MSKEENTLTIEAYISWKNKRFALKDFIKEALKEIEDNKNRIDKAIEYINRNICTNVEEQYNSIYLYGEYLNHLLDILNGEDNE